MFRDRRSEMARRRFNAGGGMVIAGARRDQSEVSRVIRRKAREFHMYIGAGAVVIILIIILLLLLL